MRKYLLLVFVIGIYINGFSQENVDKEIILLVRGDDMGSTHSANMAFIDAYQNGIMRSAEIMVVCPWFPEALKILKETPGLDVGLHLALTSEWEGYKWRPLTNAPSLTDEDGYFYPMYWANENYPEERTFTGHLWEIEEIEKELRAQIELALKYIPAINHMGIHMGGSSVDPGINELCDNLKKEYNMGNNPRDHGFKSIRPFGENSHLLSPEEKIQKMVNFLENLEPGRWLHIDHPAYDTPEMRAINHKGYELVATDRDGVTKAWTDERVKEVIKRRGIKLVSYADVKSLDH